MNPADPREAVVRVLQRRAAGNAYTEDLLAQELAARPLPAIDRALAQELAYGIVRWERTLDWLIHRKTPGRMQKPVLQLLLRLGLYQLFWLDRIPDHAAVNETVALARRLGFGPQSGFVNAVLRGYLRERQSTEAILEALKVNEPALGYSHPDWLFNRWNARWGRDTAIQLMRWNNQPPRTCARVNTLRTPAEELTAIWTQEGVAFEPISCEWLPEKLLFELRAHAPLAELSSFRNGLFYIQDPSTVLAALELAPLPGESILDLCAAPGGKTTYIAQLMQNIGTIDARDLDPRRLRLVEENCARLGVTCVRIQATPLGNGPPAQPYDGTLLDAPCSNTGVMRRRVDLRWRVRPEEIGRLRVAQLSLLTQAARAVKPGGRLIYSTCSLEPEENGLCVQGFLHEHPEYKMVRERELLPVNDGVDGAYVARLVRSAELS